LIRLLGTKALDLGCQLRSPCYCVSRRTPGELMLKIEDRGMFTAFIFYTITGVAFLALLPLSRFPPHIGILGIWSLTTAYGLFKKRKWTLYFITPLFFVATTFSLYTIYGFLVSPFFEKIRLWSAVAIAYLVLTWDFPNLSHACGSSKLIMRRAQL